MRTRVENVSRNRSLGLQQVNTVKLTAVAHTDGGMVYPFRITCCLDEHENIVPTSDLPSILHKHIPVSFVSIMTIEDDEVRVVLDIPLCDGHWGLFEVFGRMADGGHRVDTDRWCPSSCRTSAALLLTHMV
jgi:hypothetical protein